MVWEARGEDAVLSSHLVLSVDPGTDFIRRTIANCLYRRGRMVEEWVIRDSLAIAQQLGLDPDQVAREKTFVGYTGSMTTPAPPDVITVGDSGPRPHDFRPEVELVLADGNGRAEHPMTADGDGWWSPADEVEWMPGVDYGYLLDGEGPYPDPRSRRQCQTRNPRCRPTRLRRVGYRRCHRPSCNPRPRRARRVAPKGLD